VQDVSLSTTTSSMVKWTWSVDMPGVYLSIIISMDVRCFSLSSASIIDVAGVSLFPYHHKQFGYAGTMSLFNASIMNIRSVSLSSHNIMDVEGVSLSSIISMDVW
jgi:hypothetical protein